MSLHPNEVLLAPVVSEKSYSLITDRKYAFKVHKDAHKTQVRQAVEELFDVKVEDVNIVKMPAKPKRRGMYRGTRPASSSVASVASGYARSLRPRAACLSRPENTIPSRGDR